MNLEVRAAPEIENAQALVEVVDGKDVRLILYNPSWMDKLQGSLASDWPTVFAMAHEIGHHLSGHLDPAYQNHTAELEADKFAGFILYKMNATIEQTLLPMAMVSADASSDSHPDRAARMRAIRVGWEEARDGGHANVIKTVASVPVFKPSATKPEKRVALLIGNANYQASPKLKNPKNDVLAVRRELEKFGFSTTTTYDATSAIITEHVQEFKERAKDADWAVFYFAGSGLEIDAVNYMVPVEADEGKLSTFTHDYPTMSLQTVYEAVGQAKSLRLIISDACRIDPSNLPDAKNRFARPMKIVEPPRGIVVAYSTRAGQYASDGDDRLSPYAQALISALQQPGITIDKVFRRVNSVVAQETRGTQEPSVLGEWPVEDLVVAK